MRCAATLFFTSASAQSGVLGGLSLTIMSVLVVVAIIEDVLTIKNKR